MKTTLEIIDGDITLLAVDAIVNAANSSLLGGGGVDGAIHRVAGSELLRECRQYGYCPTGEAVLTRGYQLPAKYVIHAVGPVWQGGDRNESFLLARCYQRSLELARDLDVQSIAFPAISCGAYRYPVEAASEIAIQTIWQYAQNNGRPSEIYLVCFESRIKKAYERSWQNLLGIDGQRLA